VSCGRRLIFGALVLLIVGVSACGSGPEPTVTPALPPLEMAQRAADVMTSVESMHFIIEREGKAVYIDAGQLLAFSRAEGDLRLPDRMRALVRVATAFSPIELGMVVLGDEQYATDPITGEWGVLPPEWGQFNLLVLFAPDTGLQQLLRTGVSDLKLEGTEKLDERLYYRLSGRASGEKMRDMTMGFIGQGDVELEVWVDVKDFYVRQIHLVESETDPEDPTAWNIQFSNFEEPVDIEPPPVSTLDLVPVGTT
jgi:lipoprotein LprG